jgi:hypothetical protein
VKRIPRIARMDLETSSLCNRACVWCVRNTNPDKAAVAPWFSQTLMPMPMIAGVLDQVATLDLRLPVCLAHFNEPLLDPRIVEIVRLVRSYARFFSYIITNGDQLTEPLARQLDGTLNRIVVSLYDFDPARRHARATQIQSWFTTTQVIIKGWVAKTHFCPDAAQVARSGASCVGYTNRLGVNHRGQYVFCCEDMDGVFSFGSFPAVPVAEYWQGAIRKQMVDDLRHPGGRAAYPYCLACPR